MGHQDTIVSPLYQHSNKKMKSINVALLELYVLKISSIYLALNSHKKHVALQQQLTLWRLQSGMLYRPSKSLKRHGKSSSLHLKKTFLLGGGGFFVSDFISRGLLGHLGPLCLALGANCWVVVFR